MLSFWKPKPKIDGAVSLLCGKFLHDSLEVISSSDNNNEINNEVLRFRPSVVADSWACETWSNFVRTYRQEWHWWPFVAVWEQLTIATNVWFLMLGFLQLVPSISDSKGLPTYWPPVLFIIAVSLVKSTLEEFMRHRDDNIANNLKVTKWDFETQTWNSETRRADLHPGDLILLRPDTEVPADSILVSTSEEMKTTAITTIQIDGESTAKDKVTPEAFKHLKVETDQDGNPVLSGFENSYIEIVMGTPIVDINKIKAGCIVHKSRPQFEEERNGDTFESILDARPKDSEWCPFDYNNFVQRGTTLKRSEWAVGVVLYTGHFTRLFMNSRTRRVKTSKIQKSMDRVIYSLAAFMILCAICMSIVSTIVTPSLIPHWYLRTTADIGVSGFITVDEMDVFDASQYYNFFVSFCITAIRFVLMIAPMIPISLMVQLELSHWMFAILLRKDEYLFTKMEDEETKEVTYKKPMLYALDVCDDFGGVSHIFSDKTGTLTKNIMQFSYLKLKDSYAIHHKRNTNNDIGENSTVGNSSFTSGPGSSFNDNINSQRDSKQIPFNCLQPWMLLKKIGRHSKNTVKTQRAADMLRCMSLCHTVHILKEQKQQKVVADLNVDAHKMRNTNFKDFARSLLQLDGEFHLDPQRSDDDDKSPSGEEGRINLYKLLEETKYLANFSANSPDEMAIICAAKRFGLEFVERPDPNTIRIVYTNPVVHNLYCTDSDIKKYYGAIGSAASIDDYLDDYSGSKSQKSPDQSYLLPYEDIKILRTLEFDNDRKRMSVVVDLGEKDKDTGESLYQIFTKGADSSMLAIGDRILPQNDIVQDVLDIALMGYRSLVFGKKTIKKSKWEELNAKLERAEQKGDESEIQSALLKIEDNLVLLGCTGVEDILQDNLLETIVNMKTAGIRIWVLTGDKLETAVTIGRSCELISDTTYTIEIKETEVDAIEKVLMKFLIPALLVKKSSIAKGREKLLDIIKIQNLINLFDPTGGIIHQNEHNGPKVLEKTTKQRSPSEMLELMYFVMKYISIFQINDDQFEEMTEEQDGSVAGNKPFYTKFLPRPDYEPDERQQKRIVDLFNFSFSQDENNAEKSEISIRRKGSGIIGPSSKANRRVSLKSKKTDKKVIDDNDDVMISKSSLSLVLTGEALNVIFQNRLCKQLFFALGDLCEVVILCRATPTQKGQIIKGSNTYYSGLKDRSFTSLAIGDGANDVNMIMTADVGIGIAGKEGVQASQASDLALGEFQQINSVLLYWGHNILRKDAIMAYHTIHKNVLIAFVPFFYSFWNVASGLQVMDTTFLQLFSMLFTLGQTMYFCWFDRFLPYGIMINVPHIYPMRDRPDGKMYFGRKWITGWVLVSIIAAFFFVHVTMVFSQMQSTDYRIKLDIKYYGNVVYTICILGASLSITPYVSVWTFAHAMIYPLCILSWYGLWWVASAFVPFHDLYGSLAVCHNFAPYYAAIAATLATLIFPITMVWLYRSTFIEKTRVNLIQYVNSQKAEVEKDENDHSDNDMANQNTYLVPTESQLLKRKATSIRQKTTTRKKSEQQYVRAPEYSSSSEMDMMAAGERSIDNGEDNMSFITPRTPEMYVDEIVITKKVEKQDKFNFFYD